MANTRHSLHTKWFGLVVLIVSPALALFWHNRIHVTKPAHLQETIEEIGSILIFAGRPLLNHDCSKMVFLQYRTLGSRTNDSWGINVLEVATGKRTLLDELSTDSWREEAIYGQVRTFGWSPDDQFFAYSRKKRTEIVILDIASGKIVTMFAVTNRLSSGVWLSSDALICTDGAKFSKLRVPAGSGNRHRNFTV